ncbi:hypothetical protein ACGFS9_27035 [Streptomyces sp. NPDC048566]|uniref:hypothetical protein n=1 Tax=Streptomyces sp. NPDC048566 TaxID=3365569 RepID=UPI0037199043
MTTALELLLGGDAPEPSLLGWLAAHCDVTDLPAVAQVAAAAGELAPHTGWPVIGEAVQQVYSGRAADTDIPPPGLPEAPVSLATGLLRLAFEADVPLGGLTDQEVAYLIPFLAESAEALRRSVMAVEAAVRSEAAWYATALAARVSPYMDDEGRSRIAALAGRLDDRWGTRLAELVEVRAPWPSVADELDASHPSIPLANEVAATQDDAVVAESCRRALTRLAERHPVQPETDDLFDLSAVSEDEEISPPDADPDASDMPGQRPGLLGPDPSGRRTRYANTGVARPDQPEVHLRSEQCLEPDTPYLFWFEIAEEVAETSIDLNPEPVELPTGVLTVALFGFPGHIEIVDGQDQGRMEMRPDGRVEVVAGPAGTPRSGTRLFFPIRTPARPGRYLLRCHLYYKGTLLQSRLVQMQVEIGAAIRTGALTARVDYTAGIAPDSRDLADVLPLTLSVFVNDNGDGTHSLRFLGEGEVKTQTVLDERQLVNIIEEIRGALRKTAWGCSDPESSGPPFRYDDTVPPDYEQDLIDLACKGYRLWTAIGGGFAERNVDGAAARAPILRLADRLRRPGVIEIASKDHAGVVVPAALIYDHPLDWGGEEGVRLCEEFKHAGQEGDDLLESKCFRGECPSYDDDAVVCPSGFWGYRHEIGLPQSTVPTFQDAMTTASSPGGGHCIDYTERPQSIVGVSEDLAGAHTEHVRSRYRGTVLTRREDLLRRLRDSNVPQLLYFFCHGEVIKGNPMLRVGDAFTPPISWEHIADGRMHWPNSRPLVFLNGCRTAAVEPRHAMTFVKAFVHSARASGLIGTEIITYESLAADFAKRMLHPFMEHHWTIARAMREARVTLLAGRNPLGLIYVAYAPPHLRMRHRGPGLEGRPQCT